VEHLGGPAGWREGQAAAVPTVRSWATVSARWRPPAVGSWTIGGGTNGSGGWGPRRRQGCVHWAPATDRHLLRQHHLRRRSRRLRRQGLRGRRAEPRQPEGRVLGRRDRHVAGAGATWSKASAAPWAALAPRAQLVEEGEGPMTRQPATITRSRRFSMESPLNGCPTQPTRRESTARSRYCSGSRAAPPRGSAAVGQGMRVKVTLEPASPVSTSLKSGCEPPPRGPTRAGALARKGGAGRVSAPRRDLAPALALPSRGRSRRGRWSAYRLRKARGLGRAHAANQNGRACAGSRRSRTSCRAGRPLVAPLRLMRPSARNSRVRPSA